MSYKSIVFVILAFSVCAFAFAADDAGALSPSPKSEALSSESNNKLPSLSFEPAPSEKSWSFDRMKEYEKKALSISITDSVRPKEEYNQFERQWYSQLYEEMSDTISTREWVPFRGGEAITKMEFVDIVGDEELLRKKLDVENSIKAKHDAGIIWGGAGLGAMLVGMGLMIVNGTRAEENRSDVLGGIGIGLIALSLAPIGIGIYDLTYGEDIDITADAAASYANDYNLRLEREVTEM
ncbi:MAG TPA: hypothetical protein DCO86_01025 [Spirochaetaceae bacterium]|nr:hypothetical protein [Spirochaetaceae bacterium]